MTIPLLLKIKQGSLIPLFVKSSDTHLQFQDKEYKFAAIYDNDISTSSLDRLTGQSCALVLMGPTGSGKTTTLRSILAHQIAKGGDSYLTACEVSENRAFADIVDDCKRKKYVSSLPMEKQLKKAKLAESSVEKVFSERKTSATASNATSSRSCLIVTLYSDKNTVTIVDMMGNEKYDAATSTSNVFANSNVSSITQLLLTRTTRTRSSNLVTSLIFQKLSLSKMKFILHLDECGNPELIKSSLYNIVDVVKEFRVQPAKTTRATSASKYVPSYARPTAASLSPRKKPVAKSIRVTKPKPVLTPVLNRPLMGRSVTETPCVRRKPVNRTMENLYQVELKSLKEMNAQLTQTNLKLVTQAQESREGFASGVLQLKENLSLLMSQELLSLKESLAGIKNGFATLESEHSTLEAQMQLKVGEIESLESAERTAKEKIQQLEKIQRENESEINSSKTTAASLREAIESIELDIKTHKESVKNLQHEADAYQKQINSLTGEVRTRDNSISSLESELGSRQTKISVLEEKISLLKEESGTLKTENENLNASYNEQLDSLKSTYESLKNQASSLEEQITSQKAQVASLEQLITSLQGNLAQREEEVKQSQTTLHQLKESWQDELDKKTRSCQALQQQIELQTANLDRSQTTIEAHKGQIETLQSEMSQKGAELNELRKNSQIQEDSISKWKSDIAEKEELLASQAKKAQSVEAQYKKDKEAQAAKIQWTQKSLEKITSEKEELSKKHDDLISYNKYIVGKYSSALDKSDILSKHEQSNLENNIKELQAKLQDQKGEQHLIIEDLKAQVDSQKSEITKLEKYKSKCTNLESSVQAVRDESAAVHEKEISQLKSEIESLKHVETSNKQLQSEVASLHEVERANEELQRVIERFKTPSPQKLPFNPSSDIFEDDHQPHKDYLKVLKQTMKSSPKNVLRDSNIMSSDKKKLKRKALGYISSGKSPKAMVR